MEAEKKKQRMPVLDKINNILEENCKQCIHANSNSASNEECQGCPWLKELRACGTELGWGDYDKRSAAGKGKKNPWSL